MQLDYKLLIRYVSNECTEQERRQVEAWLEGDMKHHIELEEVKFLWSSSSKIPDEMDEDFNADIDWKTLKARIELEESMESEKTLMKLKKSGARYGPGAAKSKKLRRSGWAQLVRIAALLLIALGLGIFSWQYLQIEPSVEGPEYREVIMDKGQRANMVLTDGTHVTLNADSYIRFPERFSTDRREVFLEEGEAFFEVAGEPDKPFLIHTGETVIRVLGTSFVIRSYPEDEAVQVVVKEGTVGLNLRDDENIGVVLNAAQLGRFDFRTNDMTTQNVDDLELFLSWTEGYLRFRDTPMREVALQLERRYNINVEFRNQEVKDLRLTAEFQSRELRNVLTVIAASLEIDVHEHEDEQQTIVFSERIY